MNANVALKEPSGPDPASARAANGKDQARSEASAEASAVRYVGAKEPRVPVGIAVAIIAALIAIVYWVFELAHSR
jgi:hypothetical protein